MSWACDFPQELLHKPVGLVVLAGLDATYNAVHKAVWDLFCNNRKPDRVPLNFVTFPVDHDYPPVKPKRTSYEWYIPKGILQRDWMNKHLTKVPSLIITFFDLDWDEAHWSERLIECASRLRIIRNSIDKRSTKIAAVLIQKSPPSLPGEDGLAAERAATFCTECELSPKSLFVLPQTDHLFGYIIRLENAFFELVQNYFTTNIRRVRAHRDYLNRTTHQMLFIRHQFKVAFFHELKQDTHMALKHYKQAYGYCLEAKVNELGILEVKTVAGFVSYKICCLSFLHNTPLDAIEQFRKHIANFKPRVGPAHLAFEDSAWLSKQFQLFGTLFDDAIKRGLTAIQTQHPGFYYQQAALHSITRKQLCIGLCHAPNASSVQSPERMEFCGQRPWLSSLAGTDVSDQKKYELAVQQLQSLELSTDHSGEIIDLLTVAINQFQKHKSSRMRYHLLVMIGEEHYHAKDYSKALQILSRVAQEYRQERWYSLLTTVITTALRSAYLLADVPDYIKLSLEYMAEEICRSPETKSKAQADLLQILCGGVPDAQPGCDAEAVDAANQAWQAAMCSRQESAAECIEVKMSDILSFVHCKVCFIKSKYKVDEDIIVAVYVRCKSQFSIRFSQLELVFNSQKYNGECVVRDNGDLMSVVEESLLNSKDLLFLPNEVKVFQFTLNPGVSEMGKSLQVKEVQLKFNAAVPVTLRCAIGSTSAIYNNEIDNMVASLHLVDGVLPAWDVIPSRSTTDLACRSSELKLTTECEEECLLDEVFPVRWTIVNNEPGHISNVRCSFSTAEGSVNLSLSSEDITRLRSGKTEFSIGSMSNGQEVERTVYLCSTDPGPVTLTAKVLYDVDDEMFSQTSDLTLDVVEPFTFSSRFLSMKEEDRLTVNADEPFLLHFSLTNATKYSLFIHSAQLKLSEHVPEEDNRLVEQISGTTVDGEEKACEYQCLVMPEPTSNDVIPGEYVLTWRRASASDELLMKSKVQLPAVTVEHQPLYVECNLPAYGHVHRPLDVVYTLYNRTGYVQEFEASMDSCDSFAFSGHKQLHFRTLPYACQSIHFTMYPLVSGHLPLPHFKLNMMKQANANDAVSKLIPDSIYILPVEC